MFVSLPVEKVEALFSEWCGEPAYLEWQKTFRAYNLDDTVRLGALHSALLHAQCFKAYGHYFSLLLSWAAVGRSCTLISLNGWYGGVCRVKRKGTHLLDYAVIILLAALQWVCILCGPNVFRNRASFLIYLFWYCYTVSALRMKLQSCFAPLQLIHDQNPVFAFRKLWIESVTHTSRMNPTTRLFSLCIPFVLLLFFCFVFVACVSFVRNRAWVRWTLKQTNKKAASSTIRNRA